ncbi:hypothetical protein SK128_004870, partial [Halocaridina rubra]
MATWRADSQYIPSSTFTSGFLNLPSELDIRSSIRTETFKPLSPSPPKEDIILMAEFSEIEGPMPLVTVPHVPPVHVDLNDFVVKVMSTDYLNTSGEFRVCADTQMVQQDIEPGIHVYVHYFTLYDVRARGFVRPMCLSYITSDSRKILKYFSQLREQFTAATEYLKLSNLAWFAQEMKSLITNLEYTKDRYIHMQRKVHQQSPCNSSNNEVKENNVSDSDDIEILEKNIRTEVPSCHRENVYTAFVGKDNGTQSSPRVSSYPSHSDHNDFRIGKLQEEKKTTFLAIDDDNEESLLRHTTLEAVALQLMECQHILDIIKPHLDKNEVEEDLNRFSVEIMSNPQSPLYKAMEKLQMLEKPEDITKPAICILSLMKRNFSIMRSVQMLCGFGYICCLRKLQLIHDKYKKNILTLIFEDLDSEVHENPLGSLFIGNIPAINIVQSNNMPMTVKNRSYTALCWDDHFVTLLCSSPSKVSTPDSEYADALEVPRDALDVSEAGDCLQIFPVTRDDIDERGISEAAPKTVIELFNLQSSSHKKPECPTEKNSFFNEDAKSRDTGSESQDATSNKGRQTSASQFSSSSSSSWSSNPQLDWAQFEGIEEEEVVQEGVAAAFGEETEPKMNIDNRMMISQSFRLSGLVQQFCGVSHCLVHALLSGRPIVLAAADSYKPLVMLYVKALSTLLPHLSSQEPPVLNWHTGTITSHHIKQFQVMGVCIPERLHVQDLMSNATLNQVTVLNIETGHISGVAYSGILVRGVEQYVRRLFNSNSALQASLQAILVSLGMKVYLLYHLQKTTNRSTKDILKGIGVAKGDWDIVAHLSNIVQSQ